MQLLLVTLMPFSTVLLARHGEHGPSVWIYSANLIGSGCLSLVAAASTLARGARIPSAETIDIAVLVSTAVLAALVSLFSPSLAIRCYVPNAGAPLLVAGPPARGGPP